MTEKDRGLKLLGDMPLWDAAEDQNGAVVESGVEREEPVEAGGRRIGLFVDAENVRLGVLGEVIEGLMKEGEVPVRRAFGHWPGELSGEDAGVHVRHAVELRQCPRLTRGGKNAADIAMVVDVMAALERDELDVFALVSSDSDFTPLVQHLKRAGREVWGYGFSNAPDALREACGRFEFIKETVVTKDGSGGAVAPESAPKKTKKKASKNATPEEVLKRVVREAAEKHAGGWKAVSEVGSALGQAKVSAKSLGKSKLSAVLKDRDKYEIKDFGGPGGRCVRVKDGGDPGAVVCTEEELVVLREVMLEIVNEDGWVELYGLSETLRGDERWEFEKHRGKLKKRLRKLEWVEPHDEDPRYVRITRRTEKK